MVKLEVVEDEHFLNKPDAAHDGVLLEDADEDYTDTDSEISDASDLDTSPTDETLYDRITALKDIVPPHTRTKISSVSNNILSTTSSTITYGGKALWIAATSILLLGIPYALALGEEQAYMEEERQRGMMAEGATGLMGESNDAKAAL